MSLDPNIILGVQQPKFDNPIDAMGKMMALKSLATKSQTEGLQAQQAQQEFNDSQALKDATSANTTIDKTGKAVTDQGAVIKSLASSSNPSLAAKQQLLYNSQNLALQGQQMKTLSDNMDFTAKLASTVHDQPSLDQAHQTAQSVGKDTSQIPTTWDPNETPKLLAPIIKNAMSIKDQADLKIKQQEADNKKQELAMEYHKTYGGFMPGQGPQSAGAPTAPGTPVDPSTLVPQTVPTAQQAKAFEEIKDNQNIAKIAGPSIAAFDQAAKEVRPMSGGLGTSMTAFVPHIPFVGDIESAGQKAFSGAANTTVKDVEGTARQAAFESLKNNFRPQFGDSDATIASKRAGWINYLASHSAAPVNKAYGIDLQKYPSTSFDSKTFAGNDKKVIDDHPQDATAVAWAKANPGPKADKILELNGVGK